MANILTYLGGLIRSLVEIDAAGSINLPAGQKYKINGTALTANDITGLGTSGTSTVIAREDDARFSNARTPESHKNSHGSEGADPIAPDDIGCLSFGTIAVSGQSSVVAEVDADTLTLVAGTNITITTNAGTDTITITASGGGSSLWKSMLS